jgi:ATP-dependent phosphoenolpyruvate carboxykinase
LPDVEGTAKYDGSPVLKLLAFDETKFEKAHASLSGSLLKVQYKKDPVFGFDVPVLCEGVPSQILDPANTWPSRGEFFHK